MLLLSTETPVPAQTECPTSALPVLVGGTTSTFNPVPVGGSATYTCNSQLFSRTGNSQTATCREDGTFTDLEYDTCTCMS